MDARSLSPKVASPGCEQRENSCKTLNGSLDEVAKQLLLRINSPPATSSETTAVLERKVLQERFRGPGSSPLIASAGRKFVFCAIARRTFSNPVQFAPPGLLRGARGRLQHPGCASAARGLAQPRGKGRARENHILPLHHAGGVDIEKSSLAGLRSFRLTASAMTRHDAQIHQRGICQSCFPSRFLDRLPFDVFDDPICGQFTRALDAASLSRTETSPKRRDTAPTSSRSYNGFGDCSGTWKTAKIS